MERPAGYPEFRNHWIPRSSAGRFALVLFLALFALAEPPILYLVANRIEPWLAGLPFLYFYLLVDYVLLTAVLIWMHRRNL